MSITSFPRVSGPLIETLYINFHSQSGIAGRVRVISLTQITSTVLFTEGAQQLFLKYQQIYIQVA